MGLLGIVGDASADNDGYGRYEVKRLFQFRVEFFPAFEGSGLTTLLVPNVQKSLTVAAKTVSRPNIDFSEIEIMHGNESWKLSGKSNWSTELSITFDDVIPQKDSGAGDDDSQFSVSAIMYDWQNLQQNITTGTAGLSKNYKSNVVVTQFSPDTTEVERFVYHGAWPKTVAGTDWDYSADGQNIVTVTFHCDKIYRVETGPGNIYPPTSVIGTSDEI